MYTVPALMIVIWPNGYGEKKANQGPTNRITWFLDLQFISHQVTDLHTSIFIDWSNSFLLSIEAP